MGLFGDLDVSSAEDNPWAVPPNTYEADVYTVEVKQSKEGNTGMAITYKISSGDHIGKTVQEWKSIPVPVDPKNPTADEKKAASYLKMRLKSLGVPESRMNTVDVNDLQGLAVIIKVTQNGEWTNIAKVELKGDADALDSPQTFTGFSN